MGNDGEAFLAEAFQVPSFRFQEMRSSLTKRTQVAWLLVDWERQGS
jgi:hypothetical protein